MDGIINNDKASFWKKNSKTVPGRPSPKKNPKTATHAAKGKPAGGSTSFHEFQASVSDVWDLGDDEYMTISKKVSESAALNVLNTHRSTAATTAVVPVPPQPRTEPVDDRPIRAFADVPCSGSEAPKPPVSSTTTNQRLRQQTGSGGTFPGRPLQLHNSNTQQQLMADENCESKLERFEALVSCSLTFGDLCELSWSGIPVKVRPITWRLLSGYLPLNLDRRQGVLDRKREDYWNLVRQYYDGDRDLYQETYHQIHIDVPRMNPQVPIFQQKLVQKMFERILFIWAIRHPASGYVQGINDLVTPFYIVFLQEVLPITEPFETADITVQTTQQQRDIIEADSFWCLTKFLNGIQENYVFAQLGIQKKVNRLKELIQRVDNTLHRHLLNHNIDYLQFSFRWLNNLLTRELPLRCTIRLWDTYLAESDSFASFQLYVCAAFLLHWKTQILEESDFQGLMILLQNLPTHNWTGSHISLLVAEAYRLKSLFQDAPNHLQSNQQRILPNS